MLKKLMLLATAAVAVLAMGASSASANWYDNGTALVAGQNPTLNGTGTAAFTSPNGGTHCNTTDAAVQLTGGTTTAHITKFEATNIGTCEVSGGLVFLTGGTTSLKSATLTTGATAHSNGSDLTVEGIKLHNVYNNGFSITLSSKAGSPLTATLDNLKKASKLTLTGTLTSGLGELSVTAHLTDHSPTYGITA